MDTASLQIDWIYNGSADLYLCVRGGDRSSLIGFQDINRKVLDIYKIKISLKNIFGGGLF